MRVLLMLAVFPMLLAGCAANTRSDFRCAAMKNGVCAGVDAVYEASEGEEFTMSEEAERYDADEPDNKTNEPPTTTTEAKAPAVLRPVPYIDDPVPVREPPGLMRVWIAPWEDQAGRLIVSGYVYTEIETRRWTLGSGSPTTVRVPRLTPLQVEERAPLPAGKTSQSHRRNTPPVAQR